MKKLLFILVFVFLNSLFALESKKILLLNSYHQGMTWVDNITKGVNDTLNPKENNYIVHIENMDTKRHFSKEYYKSLANLYKSKYKNIKFDLILSSDNNALDFLKQYRDDIFGEVPVSFSGINHFKKSMLAGQKNYTGVQENFSAIETIDLILKLHPNTKEIYIINDHLKTGRAWENTMKEQLIVFNDKVKITYAPIQTLRQMQKSIKGLSSDTVILMGVYFADKNNKYFTYEKLGEYLLDSAQVPVYCLLQFNISDGVIGGNVISGYYQGAMMAKLGKKILQGTDINSIEVVSEGANKYIFNKKAIKKFNVDETLLPDDKKIINDEISLYEKYEFLVGVVVLFFLGSIFLGLYMFKKKDILKEKGILKIIVYGPIVFIPAIIAVLIYSILHNNQKTYTNEIVELKNEYIQRQKDITRIEVERVVNYIYLEHNRAKARLSDAIKRNPKSENILKAQFHDSMKKRILNYITNIRYGKNGYMFVLDEIGTVIAHGAFSYLVDKNMYNAKDENGVYYTRQIIEKSKNNSMKFTKYLWKNPKTNEITTKYTYSEYIPEYNIVIGSGVYSDDMDSIINNKGKTLKDKNDDQIEQILFIAFVVLITAIILSLILSSIIKNIFQNYGEELDSKNEKLEKLNESLAHRVKDEVSKNQEKDKILYHQSKMASMGEMLENIAHQWRQPLNSISVAASGIEIEKEHGILEDKHLKQYTSSILKNTSYLSETIDDFREFFKKDKKTQEFDLNGVFEHSIDVIATSLKKHSIDVVTHSDENLMLTTYKGELIQVLMNILNNAKDVLTNSKDDEKLIIISTIKCDGKISITIQDSGGGIPVDIIEKIFDAYFTTKHQSQGTGLGLHMAYNIIVQHLQGDIKVENNEFMYSGKSYMGAKFSIMLPQKLES